MPVKQKAEEGDLVRRVDYDKFTLRFDYEVRLFMTKFSLCDHLTDCRLGGLL